MTLNLNACSLTLLKLVLYFKLHVWVLHNKMVESNANINIFLNVACALLFQGHLPVSFWGECILGAVYLINRTPSALLKNKTSLEILCGQEPKIEHLHVFGCLCFAHNQRSKGDKFASRSLRCVFISYHNNKKGLKLYDLDTGEYCLSRC